MSVCLRADVSYFLGNRRRLGAGKMSVYFVVVISASGGGGGASLGNLLGCCSYQRCLGTGLSLHQAFFYLILKLVLKFNSSLSNPD